MTKLTVACVQTNATADVEVNLERLAPMIRAAREKGAEFIATPENTNLLVKERDKLFARVKPEAGNPAVDFFAKMARETGAWLLAGSLAISDGRDKLLNRSYLFDPKGAIAARYDKIHMFDADLGTNETYKESANYRGGDKAVIAATPWGKLGLTICYDLRFPHLYRALAKAGAGIITIPAAFTVPTGKLHWHVLLRARAIETGCFIMAPAQCGLHDTGRNTYGHSLIIAPSGEILAEGSDKEPGMITATLDLTQVAEARRMLPSLKHDRSFEGP